MMRRKGRGLGGLRVRLQRWFGSRMSGPGPRGLEPRAVRSRMAPPNHGDAGKSTRDRTVRDNNSRHTTKMRRGKPELPQPPAQSVIAPRAPGARADDDRQSTPPPRAPKRGARTAPEGQ